MLPSIRDLCKDSGKTTREYNENEMIIIASEKQGLIFNSLFDISYSYLHIFQKFHFQVKKMEYFMFNL